MPNYTREVKDADLTPEEWIKTMEFMAVGDQIFQNQFHGIFNAGLFGRLYRQNPTLFKTIEVALEPDLVKYCETMVQIDLDLVRNMTEARADEPIYAVMVDDDEAPLLLIDGHHRVVRNAWRGKDSIKAIIASPDITRTMIHRVDFTKRK